MQEARHQINFDLPDTLAIKTQRMGRIRRANSTHSTAFVYDLITEDSKDVDRKENISRISNLFDGIVNLNEAQSKSLKKEQSK